MRELSRAAMPIAESPRSRAASQRCGASVSAGFTAERGVVPEARRTVPIAPETKAERRQTRAIISELRCIAAMESD